jgi:hypothetical protein
METRTTGAISLGPSNMNGGYNFLASLLEKSLFGENGSNFLFLMR